ncbi:MAG: HAD family hydrolase [Actinobacteria bacterium]|nr:MAG: HAD family hydrolase [Actinomycetota bacterium]
MKMVTGDTAATARAVAERVGIRGPLVTGTALRDDPGLARTAGVIAEVFPDDKHAVVRTLQEAGHTVGMTGDGVNDAPALRQAEVGIAVEGAVDVARAAASMALTDPGLVDLVAAVPRRRWSPRCRSCCCCSPTISSRCRWRWTASGPRPDRIAGGRVPSPPSAWAWRWESSPSRSSIWRWPAASSTSHRHRSRP